MNKPKLPRTHKELSLLLSSEYSKGYTHGTLHENERWRLSSKTTELDTAKAKVRVDSIRAIANLTQTMAQTAEALTRAMCSEAGQL